MNPKNRYKYSNHGELWTEMMSSFLSYFKPFFNSFLIKKKTFVLQIINLVLVFVLLNLFLGGFLDRVITRITEDDSVGLKILLLIMVVGSLSAIKANKVLRWQTLFELNHKLTKQCFWLLMSVNLLLYGDKQFRNEK